MTRKSNSKGRIGNALIWAATLLAIAFIQGENNGQPVIWLLLTGWFATDLLFGGLKDTVRCERALMRRLLGLDRH